jgi:predicted AlkP superfamily phosphohydrolase/phosphomutase
MRKVIVIGLDGFEPKIAESMVAQGKLPNLARLQEQGGYSRVKTTYPAQTPVAWSTFSTGTNPGGHGIFDFLSRDPKTYLPILGLSKYEQKNAFVPPKVVNMRRGTPIWDLLTQAGIPSTVIRCPCTYPPDNIQGKLLSGVGVPDLRGGLGTSTFYTSRQGVRAESSEKVVQLQVDGKKEVPTFLIGPRNPKKRNDLTLEITLHLDRSTKSLSIHSDGQPNRLELKEGKWSRWLRVKFKLGLLQSVQGMVRFYLRQLEPELELYASPINFDPEAPLFPISHPENYANEVQARLGNFYTIGMAEDHDGLINGRFSEGAYLEQCAYVMREREKMMLYELERTNEGLFFCLFDTPDRLQHMMWRFLEADHPANCNGTSAEMRHAIEQHYMACDDIVGKAFNYADDQTLFITLSDHGMNSFQRGLNLNTWLYENGFLALKNGIKPGEEENGDFFHNVDWSRTKAYSLGLGCIFLNLDGREANGIVREDDVESVKSSITKGLTGLRDEQRGKIAVRSVVTREQVYRGSYADESPDLVVNFSEGYRVSWGTPLGGVPAGLFEDNVKRWGGDHVIDPELVPGILFMNQPFKKDQPSLVDLAPTILNALGVPKGSAMEGEDLIS